MRRAICVSVILLALGAGVAPLRGQEPGVLPSDSLETEGFRLEQNYPNPFNPTTRIPFVLDESLFETSDSAVVSVRIFNVLQQLVAIPTALDHPDGSGRPVDRLAYRTPGRKEAYWDGIDRSGRQVASGIYYLQLIVNGESQLRKMVVAK